MGDAGDSTAALPSPRPVQVSDGITLLPPLSRKGVGPGVIVLVPDNFQHDSNLAIKNGVPSPLIKWAEEGYAVVQIGRPAFSSGDEVLKTAIDALGRCSDCQPQDKIGLVSYDPSLFQQLSSHIPSRKALVGAIIYTDTNTGVIKSPIPSIQHIAGKQSAGSKLPRTPDLTVYGYDKVSSSQFATPFTTEFDYAVEAVSQTRNLTFFKRHDIIGGPIFDLEAIWDEHTYFEFEVRDVAKTMATMVQEPYVNHIPTMTGGIGRERLTHFYTNHFVFQNPKDTELELISRTVGVDRVVDEFLFKFTHDMMIDWLLPGVPPTGKYCEVPFTGIINIRGDRLYHEHIAWDQASLLRQVGLLPEYLPWTYADPEASYVGKDTGKDVNGDAKHKFEYRLPVAGTATAAKLRNKNDGESNEMFAMKMRKST